MRPFRPLLLAVGLLPFLASGCAKSPDGVVVRSSNRFQAQLLVQAALNPNYYYSVAFDDTGGDAQGPQAIIGNTTVLNGVVGGTFRLMVLYHGNTFQVFYRSTPSDASTEREITGTNNLFVVTPRAGTTTQGANTIGTLNFTLNLDAQVQLPNGTTAYIFPRGTTNTTLASNSFDINAITTNTIIRDPNDNRVKPVDAFGAQQVATPVEVQIGGTRTTSITDATGADIDENFADSSFTTPNTSTYVDFSQIDISQLQIAITRSTS